MTATETEIFAKLKSNVLDENRSFLCSNLEPKSHYPYLRSKKVLSKDDEEQIESQITTKLKSHKMIDILMQRSQGYDHLVMSLIQEKTQIFVAEKLNKAFEKKRKTLTALVEAKKQHQGGGEQSQITLTTDGKQVQPQDKLSQAKTCEIYQRDNKVKENTDSVTDSTTSDAVRNELDSLPIPVLSTNSNNNNKLQEQHKMSRIHSCENSEDSTSDHMSVSDSLSTVSSRNESKA